MKTLLIFPPVAFSRNSYLPNIFLPLGILYVAAAIKAKGGDEVEIYDARQSAKINREKGLFTLGDNWDEVEKRIYKAKPDIVGISNLSFAQMRNVYRIAKIAKNIDKNTLVAVGGQHPSVCPEDPLSDNNIDIVIKGEGEEIFPRLLEMLKAGESVEGLTGVINRGNFNEFKKSPSQNYILDLDKLPFPAYQLYDIERHFYLQNNGFSSRVRRRGKRPMSIITSRGCPFSCIFCLGHGVMGKQWRVHSVDYVMRHIDFLVKELKVDLIHFEDDNINFNCERFGNLLDRLRNLEHKIYWDTPNGVRADRLDKSIIIKAKESRCDYLILGVESGDQEILDKIIHKSLKLSVVKNASKLCKLLNLRLFAFFIIGFPGEKIANMKKTIDFALNLFWKYGVIPAVFWASPYKGTKLYETCSKKGYFTETITCDSFIHDHQLEGRMLIKTEDFTPQDIRRLLYQYNRKLKLLMLMKGIVSPNLLIEYLRIFFKNFFLVKNYLRDLMVNKDADTAH